MSHEHCWHVYRRPLMIVLKDGHIVQKCCKCDATRTVHAEHAHERDAPLYGEHRRREWEAAV